MNSNLVLTAKLHAKPERRTELFDLLQSFAIKARAESGRVEYRRDAGAEDRDLLFLYEVWATGADFDRRLQAPTTPPWPGPQEAVEVEGRWPERAEPRAP